MSEDPLIGAVLGERYRIDELIGTGAMGRVYRAEHILMRKRVALKVLHQELTAVPEVKTRFEREARAAAHIEHPHVAAATDFGKLDDGSFFLVLEYVEGKPLSTAIESGPLSVNRVLEIAMQIASALESAHARGIVHRDLKPDNLLLVDGESDEEDFVKILDFGIAKMPTEKADGERITQVGLVYGTAEYMAPEQALGQEVDARADLYALGVVMYEMLTGRRPYDGPAVALLGQQLSKPLPPISSLSNVSVPPEVEQFVVELLAIDKELRPESASVVREQLVALNAAIFGRGPNGIKDSVSNGASVNSEELTPRIASTTQKLPAPAKTQTSRTLVFTFVFGALGVALAVFGIGTFVKRQQTSAELAMVPQEPALEPVIEHVDERFEAQLQKAKEEGTPALERLREDYPGEGIILAELAVAYAKNQLYLEATTAARDALGLDPKLNENAKIAGALFRSAQSPKARSTTLRLLQGAMGEAGIGIIYDLATTDGLNLSLRAEAKQLLLNEEVRLSASPALLLLLELEEAKSCAEFQPLVNRAALVGDKRALPALHQLELRTGCGQNKAADCYDCLRGNDELGSAIRTIQQRGTLSDSQLQPEVGK